ncbi:MAG: hypothetical protein K2X86_02955 [Cytophagaceae bacterium]|nr:hypothetical protein [Cytophagaceae bacterium]
MSSSLDDLEPYEIFQNELDECLKMYEAELKKALPVNKAMHEVKIINLFIEEMCFEKSISNFEELRRETESKKYDKAIHDFLNFAEKS